MRILFLNFLFFFILGGCHKPCTLPNYAFLVNDLFSPEVDSIKGNDTLWLNCTINKDLYDINTQKTVNFSYAENLGTTLMIADISQFRFQRGGVDSFDYVKRHGNIYTDLNLSPQTVKQISFEENNTSYLLEVGLIAKKRGTYILTVSDTIKQKKGCVKANFEIKSNKANSHLYYYQNWRPGYTLRI